MYYARDIPTVSALEAAEKKATTARVRRRSLRVEDAQAMRRTVFAVGVVGSAIASVSFASCSTKIVTTSAG